MKKIFKIFSLLLAIMISFSALACKDDGPNNNGDDLTETNNAVNANHYANVTERDEYLVENGKTDYVIVIPTDAYDYELKAASLINDYYKKALGVLFAVITDVSVSTTGKYISIGDTTLMRNSGISVAQDKFGTDGYRVLTKGDVIFISGARYDQRTGTYYGAQEFLKQTINWRAYAETEVLYDVKTAVKMMDFDVVEIPDFDSRVIAYDITASNVNYRDLLRLDGNTRGRVTSIPYYAHSHFEVLPPDVYCDEHPEWYWYDGSYGGYTESNRTLFNRNAQLCLTNEEMIQAFIDEVTEQFMAYPKANFVHLGIQDSLYYCACKNCTKWLADHNNTTYSGLNVWFTNRVARAVSENIHKVDPTRELTFRLFAYFATIKPPVKLVNGEWVADHEDVIPDDNVFVQFTPLHSNGYETIDNIEKNKTRYEYFMGWKAVTSNLSVWKYCVNFAHYQISHKNWDTTAEDYRFYYENGVTDLYDQGPISDGALQMKEMRVWISSQLMWNVNLNWQALAEEFIDVYYGDSADKILESYNLMTTWQEKLRTVDDAFQAGKVQVVDTEREDLWPFSYVESQRKILMQAFEALEPLKEKDIVEYEKYYWRVAAVYYENIFLQMEYHMEKYTTEYCKEQIDLFESITVKFNLVGTAEGSERLKANYIDKWRGSNNA